MRYYGFFSLVIGGSPTEGDGKLLLLEIGLIYDMITLCIDRVEDRTRGGYYLNWILDGGYYMNIILR